MTLPQYLASAEGREWTRADSELVMKLVVEREQRDDRVLDMALSGLHDQAEREGYLVGLKEGRKPK